MWKEELEEGGRDWAGSRRGKGAMTRSTAGRGCLGDGGERDRERVGEDGAGKLRSGGAGPKGGTAAAVKHAGERSGNWN